MATNKERLTIFENIIARTGFNRNALVEFAKAMSSLNGLQSFNDLNPPQSNLGAPQAPISPEQTQTIPAQESGLEMPQNTPTGMV